MDQIARILAQHARTAQLLGVDFVPVYRSADPEADAGADTSSAAPTAPPQPTDPSTAPPAIPPSEPPALRLSGTDAEPRRAPSPRRPDAPRPAALIEPKADPHAAPPAAPADDPAAALAALEARYREESPHAAFGSPHTNVVFGEGSPNARLMFIGEAPGAEEDRLGRPFVGRSGEMLNKWIGAMGLERPDCYIANVLKVRPPNNATPTSEEARISAPWLLEQVRIIAPEAIVTLGLPASRLLLGTDLPMNQLRGKWWSFTDSAGREVPVMPTYHPAYLLRAHTPENRGKVWSDLQQVMQRLGLERS